jgi:hypothetical protein
MSSEAILKPELYNGLAIMLDVRLFSIKKWLHVYQLMWSTVCCIFIAISTNILIYQPRQEDIPRQTDSLQQTDVALHHTDSSTLSESIWKH